MSVAAGRHLPSFAAVIAVATSYTEIKLRNQLAQTDHDSEGLFQQRISIYTRPVADDPVKATNAFLDRLVRVPNWQSNAGRRRRADRANLEVPRALPAQPPAGAADRRAVLAGRCGRCRPGTRHALRGTAPATPAIGSGPAICAGGGGAMPGGGGTVAGRSSGRPATTWPAQRRSRPGS